MISCALSDQYSSSVARRGTVEAVPDHQREQVGTHQASVLDQWHLFLLLGLDISTFPLALHLPGSTQLSWNPASFQLTLTLQGNSSYSRNVIEFALEVKSLPPTVLFHLPALT